MRPTVAQIRLSALRHNYELLAESVRQQGSPQATQPVGLVAVVKANAYGHGLALCAQALVQAGAHWLGVTSVEEADSLLAGLRPPARLRVVVMSGYFPGEEEAVLQLSATPQVWEPWHFERLDAAARRRGFSPQSVAVHLEIDTGMSRQGVQPGAPLELLLAGLRPDSPVWVEGLMTHLSSPEELSNPATSAQLASFEGALRQVQTAGLRPRWVHAGSSANAWSGAAVGAIGRLAQAAGAGALVRPGLGLYGIETRFTPELNDRGSLEPVLRWVTRVTSLREVSAGTPVGYNETFRAPEGGARLALLPVGYADGLRRELSNRGFVLLKGKKVPVVGRVSMDQTVIDISGLPEVAIGAEVVLIGDQDGAVIEAAEVASWCGTIAYEVVCGIGARVPRVGT